jgi:FkbM family methyltransferase
MAYKHFIRQLLNFLHLDLTKNLEYDRLTKQIMKQTIHSDSNCLDVGCHKGEILEIILKLAPKGKHFAFEPIPELFTHLEQRFSAQATIYSYALADASGTATFNHVKNAPAYSGLEKREYKVDAPEIEEIQVELRLLDELIPADTRVDFVKIDVEGGEFAVLKGGARLLSTQRPVIIFECGMGASDYYGTEPCALFDFITGELGLKISLLKAFLKKQDNLKRESFIDHFKQNREYYFVAHP